MDGFPQKARLGATPPRDGFLFVGFLYSFLSVSVVFFFFLFFFLFLFFWLLWPNAPRGPTPPRRPGRPPRPKRRGRTGAGPPPPPPADVVQPRSAGGRGVRRKLCAGDVVRSEVYEVACGPVHRPGGPPAPPRGPVTREPGLGNTAGPDPDAEGGQTIFTINPIPLLPPPICVMCPGIPSPPTVCPWVGPPRHYRVGVSFKQSSWVLCGFTMHHPFGLLWWCPFVFSGDHLFGTIAHALVVRWSPPPTRVLGFSGTHVCPHPPPS
jgi:hypothetical protein